MSVDDSSAQRAYRVTKDRVLGGDAPGGLLLSEVELAAELGVSRTPVHEAFLRLAAEGLLEMLPRRGALVVPVTAADAVDLLEMRLALETAAARRLSRTPAALPAVRAELTDLVERQAREAGTPGAGAPGAGAPQRFAEADDAFHRCLVERAGNAVARRFYGSLQDRQRQMMSDVAHADPSRLHTMIDQHRALVDAVERRDVAAFEAALLEHLQTTYRVVLA